MVHENFDVANAKDTVSTSDSLFREPQLRVLDLTLQDQSAIMLDMRKTYVDSEILPNLSIEGVDTKVVGTSAAQSTAQDRQVVPAKSEAVDVSPYFSGDVDCRMVDAGRVKVIKENGRYSTDVGVMGDPQKFEEWLNTSIPRDGTRATDDRRAELIIKTVLANSAINDGSSPSMQVTEAYVALNGLRFMMRSAKDSFSGDPGLANAEHFFETAHRVAGQPFDGTATDLSSQVLRGAWSAPVWEGISQTYNVLKKAGLKEGSDPENQHKWESAGIGYGVSVFNATFK